MAPKATAKLRPCDPSTTPTGKKNSKSSLKSSTRKTSKVKKSKAQSKGSTSTTKASIPMKGISTIVNGQKVGYLVRGDHQIRIFSSICTALETAKRTIAFKEALANIQTHRSYSMLRWQGLV